MGFGGGFKGGEGDLGSDLKINDGTIKIKEQASAESDSTAYGQIWVKSNAPCDLYFTDDTGQDIRITNDGSLAAAGSASAVKADDIEDGDAAVTLQAESGNNVTVNATAAQLQLKTTTSGELDITSAGTLDINAVAVDLDGSGAVTIDTSDTTNGVKIGASTSGMPITLGHGTSETTVGDNLVVTGDLKLTGNVIKASDGGSTITLDTSDNVTIAGDLQIDGNNIKDAGGNQGITFDGSGHTTIDGNLTVTGNVIKASDGGSTITMDTSDNVTVAGTLTCSTSLTIGSAAMSEADLEQLDGITAGTAAASKAVVLDGSKNIATIGTVGCGAITSTGASSMGSLSVAGALDCDTSFTLDSVAINATELGYIDGVTAGTATASKAVVLDSNKDIGTIRNLTIDGTLSDGNYTFDTSGNVSGLGTVGSGAITSSGIIKTDDTTDATSKTDGSLQTDGGLSVAKAIYNGTAATLAADSGVVTMGSTTAATVSAAGILNVNNTTEATSATDGSLQTDGGLSVVKSAVIGDDLDLLSDGAILNIGSTSKFTVTDQGANNCVMATSGHRLAFGHADEYVSGDGTDLTINSSGEINLDATTVDLNGALDVSGASQFGSTITVGVDGTGYDVKFFGATSSAYMLWDEDEDDLVLAGAARAVVPDGQLVLGSTAVSSTAAELNKLDGADSNVTAAKLSTLSALSDTEIGYIDGSGTSVVASKAVVADSNRDVATLRNLTIDGTLSDGNYTFDTSGNVSGLGTVGCGAITTTGNFTGSGALTSFGSGLHRITVDQDIRYADTADASVVVELSGVKIPANAIITRVVAVVKTISNLGSADSGAHKVNIQMSATSGTSADAAISTGTELLGGGVSNTISSDGAAEDVDMTSLADVWMCNDIVKNGTSDQYLYICNGGDVDNGTTDPSAGTLTVIVEYYGMD